jgi:hypothetical protein
MERENLVVSKELVFKKLPKATRMFIIISGIASMFAISLIWQKMFEIPMLITEYIGIPILLVVVILHETMHGIGFLAQGYKTRFGCAVDTGIGLACYTTSPGSIVPRARMILILLAPQLLTALALLFSFHTTGMLPQILVAFASYNFGGACADLYSLTIVLIEEGEIYIEDTGTGAIIYRRDN